jgi:hypothetical protein
MMTLGEMLQRMMDERVEGVNEMVTALSGDNSELVEALCVTCIVINESESAAEQFHALVGVLGFGVAIGYYRALQQCDDLLGLAQTVRDKREGWLGPC